MLFDFLRDTNGDSLLGEPLIERRAALDRFHAEARAAPSLRLSPFTREREKAERWLEVAGDAIDGVVAKRLDGPSVPGERAMLKVKRQRTAACVVDGFRYGAGGKDIGSVLLGLDRKSGGRGKMGAVWGN